MCDVVSEYRKYRLPERLYCETACPFHDQCVHLSQYEGLGTRDFIASCAPNILFDLNTHGYLQSLVTATSDPSDGEVAIDAMLGTQSESTQNFDFAILNDYTLNSLYTDITFRASEFKTLKKAWSGTPTAEFADLVQKAFKKKKPHKIVKALRRAFQSTSEHHKDIAKHLTQHARNGVVEDTTPKGSKESQRLLTKKQVRYDDGGTQFIAVDFAAYQELTEKEIPTVHPQHLQTEPVGEKVRVPHTRAKAVAAGVDPSKLTPGWLKGATPIDLLDIFLSSLGNDKNAPVHKEIIATDEPEPILTFSVPPQAPVGIIPHITMLSATTDTEDVQQAFDGQQVNFSVHTGGNIQQADGVQVYQYQDARLTAASIFNYPKDAKGKRQLQEEPTGLTPTAEKRLAKLNDWAQNTDGLTAFISYKEFTESLTEPVDGFDIVTHFDKVAGLNFDGLKFPCRVRIPKSQARSCHRTRTQTIRIRQQPLAQSRPHIDR